MNFLYGTAANDSHRPSAVRSRGADFGSRRSDGDGGNPSVVRGAPGWAFWNDDRLGHDVAEPAIELSGG